MNISQSSPLGMRLQFFLSLLDEILGMVNGGKDYQRVRDFTRIVKAVCLKMMQGDDRNLREIFLEVADDVTSGS
jgi:hypothetical protein